MLKASGIPASELLSRFRDLGEWDKLDEEEAADLETILATVHQDRFPGAILPLPRRDAPPVYYGAAGTTSDWRTLRTLLLAFAGPTVSSFAGRPHELDPNNEAERLLARGGLYTVARIEPAPATAFFLRRSLRQLAQTAQRMPVTAFALGEPRHRLLRRFFNYVAARDLDAALECVARLRRDLRLDTLNLAFLEIHARAAIGDWVGIRSMRDFLPLLQARKPKSVTCALNEALYRVHLAELVDGGDIAGAIAQYRSKWLPRLGGLPIFPLVGGTEGLARLYTLDALARNEKQPPSWLKVLEEYDLGALAEPLREAFPIGAPPAKQPQAELDRLTQARAALIDAGISDILSAKRAAVAHVALLSDGERTALLETIWVRKLWQELVRQVGEQPPGDWPSWLEQLNDAVFREIAADVAQAAVDEWPHENAFPDPPRFAEALRAAATGPIGPVISHGLPHLVAWLRADPKGARPDWRPIYLAVVDAYSLAGDIDAAAREATLPMIELALEAEPHTLEYRDLVEQADMLAGDDPGVHGAWWPLKVAELLLWYRTPDVAVRNRFLHHLLEKLRTCLPRLTPSQRHVARDLSRASEWPWPQSDDPGEELAKATLSSKLGGKTVAIYTLVERAAEQARDMLAVLTPTTRVELCADHVASPRLIALARNADIFVMVTGAAKHAATDAIKRERSKEKPLLMPLGKGASSLLEAIDRWAGLLHKRD